MIIHALVMGKRDAEGNEPYMIDSLFLSFREAILELQYLVGQRNARYESLYNKEDLTYTRVDTTLYRDKTGRFMQVIDFGISRREGL